MLFIPFAIFLLNGSFLHAEIYDRVFTSQEKCMESVKGAISKALEDVPDGGSIKGGCLPLGDGVKAPQKDPRASTDPKGVFYDPLHPENLLKYTSR
jgi:hypothetical protein